MTLKRESRVEVFALHPVHRISVPVTLFPLLIKRTIAYCSPHYYCALMDSLVMHDPWKHILVD
jgi:hypothetical protein